MMAALNRLHIGVLALQGDFERHVHQLRLVGAEPIEVRLPRELDRIDALIFPGGESTTMDYIIDRFHLRQPLTDFIAVKPVWGTCAGMILLSTRITDNQSKVTPFGAIDVDVIRNGYGRQVFSFEEPITACLGDDTVTLAATFIRAPRVTRLGASVEVLARYHNDPVLLRQGHVLVSSFHTELDDDTRLLKYFLEETVLARREKCPC